MNENLTKRQFSDKILDQFYDQMIKIKSEFTCKKPKSSVHIKNPKTDKKIDEDNEKYKLVLEFLKALLVKIGKEQMMI